MKHALSALAGATALAISLIVSPVMAQDGGIVVYNAQHESLTNAWVEGFTKATGIKVTVRHGGDSDFSNQIVAEGAASPADVFLTENSPAMVLVEQSGLFAPVDDDTLAQVPKEYQPASGKWVGIAARSTVFAYNKTRLTAGQLPKSLLELADPSWKGRWAASPSGADFQAIVSALLQLRGEAATADWLKAMKENFTAYKGNSTVMKAVNAGEVDGGVIYHYYYYGDQAKTGENSKNVGLHYFKNQDPGAFVSVSGGGVLASSKHPKEAQAFLKWVTGKAGQDVLKTGNSFEYAVGKGAASNPALMPLADLQAPKVDATTLNSRKVTDLMTAAGLL
ncbi:iron ABC transporter substrate-binding protein [Mesorhizobium sp.]|uniref:iron ABC transporter substrate-binding protein n=1 Tax=Mesorhizobium sp. TaxID=1871066 RepID=UPI000FE78DBC|nr:iron ABC transporter substrate-binding protein [Mesorhizobium sp.]RWK54093.1 MAG: iron ABC transporter substrate-binding protein [Mesorhizobium sp.]TIP45321.1 MAG: iron ABC transporter substrate-binding protein [Mesorhizobium sp.]